MSFIQRMSVTQPSGMIDKNSGGSWHQKECVCERWGKGQRKVRSQEDTSCAFHNFLRVIPFESIRKISQGHYISRICEDFFFLSLLVVPEFVLGGFMKYSLFFISWFPKPTLNQCYLLIAKPHGHVARL